MKRIVRSNCKINLGLEVVGKRGDGYHDLDMVMAPINLWDTLEIEFKGEVVEGETCPLSIITNLKYIPTDKRNILWKVYDLFYSEYKGKQMKVAVKLKKIIPSQGGLGGGSANGGTFIKELNRYHKYPFSNKKLKEMTKSVGADIPFFIDNKTARVKGIGEKIEKIENNLDCDIIVVKPKFGVRTPDAFKGYGKIKNKKTPNFEKILKGLKENNMFTVLDNIENNLEDGVLFENKEIGFFKEKLLKVTGKRFVMTGSGSCYYTLLPKGEGKSLCKMMKQKFSKERIYLCRFIQKS